MRPGRPRETGPCVRCGHRDWGIRHSRYTSTTGTVRVYESRYCLECSRRRGRRNKQAVRS